MTIEITGTIAMEDLIKTTATADLEEEDSAVITDSEMISERATTSPRPKSN